jgi:3-dehydroquinate synthetase
VANLVGAFHQPVLVIADTGVLDTLSPRQFRAGYAEVAKYGVLGILSSTGSTPITQEFSRAELREHAIAMSCRAKAAIVARDERETGDRALLNLGHTFGHALEAATGFSDRLFHGEGVAVGMVLAAEFSARLNMIPAAEAGAFSGIWRPSACRRGCRTSRAFSRKGSAMPIRFWP